MAEIFLVTSPRMAFRCFSASGREDVSPESSGFLLPEAEWKSRLKVVHLLKSVIAFSSLRAILKSQHSYYTMIREDKKVLRTRS